MALNIYKKMMNHGSRTALHEIIDKDDDLKSIAEYNFRNALETNSLESNLSSIANSYTQGRRNVEAELCSDTSKLMKLQKSLNSKYVIYIRFLNRSIINICFPYPGTPVYMAI